MRGYLILHYVVLIFLFSWNVPALCDGPKEVYIQMPGQHPKEAFISDPFLGNDLGLKLSMLGYEAKNVFDRIERGKYTLHNIKILVIAPFCTRNQGVNAFLFNERERLRDFIRRGAQGEARYYEHLLPLGMNLIRS